MNYFEFKQQLLKDSFTKDEEFHRLRKEDLRCAKAYEKAMAFEKTLKAAFEIKTPKTLKDSIVLRQTTHTEKMPVFQKYAIAASVFLSFIIASSFLYVKNSQPGSSASVEKFITALVALESNVKISDEPISLAEVNEIFSEYNAELTSDVGKVHFAHDCHTPGGTGVHMIVSTSQGPVTVYYMPNTTLQKDRVNFEINDSEAMLVAMEKGSVAIIADTHQQLASIEPMLQNNLMFL